MVLGCHLPGPSLERCLVNTVEQSKTISEGRRKGECLRLLERQLLVPSHGREKVGKLEKGNSSDVYEPGVMPVFHILRPMAYTTVL